MFSVQAYGDSAVLIEFGTEINEQTRLEILSFTEQLKEDKIEGVINWIPAYTTVVIVYDVFKISFLQLKRELEKVQIKVQDLGLGRLVRIPVCYDTKFSLDIEEVMLQTGLSRDEIIELHTTPEYQVHMLGFVPGFFYLGGLDTRLHCGRKEKPRIKIEAGAVGIAGSQTGVYPLESPGGWQLLGKTPIAMFDKDRKDRPFYVRQGDRVQFYEITLEQYKQFNL